MQDYHKGEKPTLVWNLCAIMDSLTNPTGGDVRAGS